MSVTIYNALSLDGFIANKKHERDFVKEADAKQLEKVLTQMNLVIMGSTTYLLSVDAGLVPYGELANYVFTQDPAHFVENDLVHFVNHDPVSFVREHAGENILVVGGGKLNATLLKANVVTDIIVSIHPVILGDGLNQFADIDAGAKTELHKVSEEDIGDDVVQIHYQVV